MEYIIDNQFLRDCLEEPINAPGPVNYYEEVNPVVEKYAAMFRYQMTHDRKHMPYITTEGRDNSRTVLIGRHLDTLGMMVRRTDDDGSIRIWNLGGLSYTSLEGEAVWVVTRDGRKYSGLFVCQSHSTYVSEDARSLERGENTILIRLDEGVSTKAKVGVLGIQHGDTIYVEPRLWYTEKGSIRSRSLDDRAAVVSISGMLKHVVEQKLKPKYRTLLTFPHYEKIGYGGAYLPPGMEEFVAVDIGLIGPDYNDNEHAVSICCKDFHSPYDRGLATRIINQTKRAGCDYAVDTFCRYGTDVSAALKADSNVYAVAIGTACYCSYGMERTHIDGLNSTTKLLMAYVLDI